MGKSKIHSKNKDHDSLTRVLGLFCIMKKKIVKKEWYWIFYNNNVLLCYLYN